MRTTKHDRIEIASFTVPVEWVNITIEVPADLAGFIESRSQPVQRGLASYVYYLATSVESERDHNKALATPDFIIDRISERMSFARRLAFPEGFQPVTGRKMVPFILTMKRDEWDLCNQAANMIEVSPSAFVRGALCDRRQEIIEYDESTARPAPRADRTAFVRHVADVKGMDADELVEVVIIAD